MKRALLSGRRSLLAACLSLLGLAALLPAQASTSYTTYGGRAFVAYVNTLLTGPMTLSDTGQLSPNGGWQGNSLHVCGVGGILTADILGAYTAGESGRATSEASLADVDILPGTLTELKASFIQARSVATCSGVQGASSLAQVQFLGQTINVTGAPNQTINVPGVATLVLNEQIDGSSGDQHVITVNALHLVVNGVAEVILSSAQSEVVCNQTQSGPCDDFIGGNGWILVNNARANFAFHAGLHANSFSPDGHLEYCDHGANLNVHGTDVIVYTVPSASSRHFEGDCTVNGGSGYTYKVDVTDNGSASADTFAISLSSDYSASGAIAGGDIDLHHHCKLGVITFHPNNVCGGESSTGKITLLQPAPSGGWTITLSSSNTGAATVPARVMIPAGATSATFPVQTQELKTSVTVMISASLEDETISAGLHVNAPGLVSIKLSTRGICGGLGLTGTVTLGCSHHSNPITINLSCSDSTLVHIPSTCTIPAGALSAKFTILTGACSADSLVTIKASYNGVVKSVNLTIKAALLVSVKLSAGSCIGGDTLTGTITLCCPAPSGGLVVKLSSSLASVVSVDANVTIPPGAISVTFQVKTFPVLVTKLVKITSVCNGITKDCDLDVDP